jgi:uncharacterized phiE125 gp8 family phage protein
MILITAPAEEPVTLADAKLHCKADGTDDDTLITALITSARKQAEHILGRVLVTQTWEQALDVFPSSEIKLETVPVQSITSLKYIDANSVEQTIDPANYTLDLYGITHWIIPASSYTWPVTDNVANAVKIRFVAGYGAAAAVPEPIKAWIKMAVSTMYSQRDGIIDGRFGEVPRDFFAGLLDPYVVPRV